MPVVKTGKSSTVNDRYDKQQLSKAGRNDEAKPEGRNNRGTDAKIQTQKAKH